MDALKRLGFSDYEVAVYVALVENGRSTARDISKHSSVPPTAVYPNLRSLIRKGFVQHYEGVVSLFEAIPARLSLTHFVDKKLRSLTELKHQAVIDLEALARKKKSVSCEDPISFFYGVEASDLYILDVCSSAQKMIYILGWKLRKVSTVYKLFKPLKLAAERGVDVRILFARKEGNAEMAAKLCLKTQIKTRYFPFNNFSIILRDGLECKIALKKKELSDQINLMIQDKDLGGALTYYFLTLWKKAKPMSV
ncbi:MAG: helix-turn-helix domain-containing protein [Nanoarchaeota archaeon]